MKVFPNNAYVLVTSDDQPYDRWDGVDDLLFCYIKNPDTWHIVSFTAIQSWLNVQLMVLPGSNTWHVSIFVDEMNRCINDEWLKQY